MHESDSPAAPVEGSVSPDVNAVGLLPQAPEALRYNNASLDPEAVAMRLSALATRGARILDVGCGTGTVSIVLAQQRDATIIGIEPDGARVAEARKRGLDVKQGFLTPEFVAAHGPFDHVVFADVLEHVPSPGDLLKMAAAGLKPGGSVLISVPNVAHWSVRWNLLFGRFEYVSAGIMDATHLRWFTRRTIGDLATRCGLQVTALQCTTGLWLHQYNRRPWRWLSLRWRHALIRRLARRWPQLFGCQHIVRATRLTALLASFGPALNAA